MPMFSSLAFAVVLHVSTAQVDSFPDLYVIEDAHSGRGVVEVRNLVRVSIDRENKLVSKILISREVGFFGEIERARIALGRFVVIRRGAVVDIEGRKVIHDEKRARVLGVENAKVVYRIGGSSDVSGLFSFDLNERKIAKVPQGSHWDLPGLKSPDERMSVQAGRGVIRLYRLGKAPVVLTKDVHIKHSIYASTQPFSVDTLCLWLDGERILAGQTNRKLVILTTQGAVEGSIEIKDAPAEVLSPPELWRDAEGRVIYACEGEYFLIDVPNGAVSPLKRLSLGHGFEASVAADEEQRRSVYYDGKAIGQWFFRPLEEATTAPGLLAIGYFPPGKNTLPGSAHGVAVWSKHVGDWRTIEMSINDLIGWSR